MLAWASPVTPVNGVVPHRSAARSSLAPARIAHGAPTIDDPALMAELIARGVTLDLCPTSNVQAAIVPSVAAHPLARLHRAGVPVTLSTDDRTVSDLTLVREYANAVDAIGLTLPELWAIDRHALEVAFLHHDEALRARLLAEFDAFAAAEPALSGSLRLSAVQERASSAGSSAIQVGRAPCGRAPRGPASRRR